MSRDVFATTTFEIYQQERPCSGAQRRGVSHEPREQTLVHVIRRDPGSRSRCPRPAPTSPSRRQQWFQTMMGDAVARMHAEMDVPFSGDADRDFARMMI